VQRCKHQCNGVIGARVAVNDQAVLLSHGGIVGAEVCPCGRDARLVRQRYAILAQYPPSRPAGAARCGATWRTAR
jgi:hypothetical protein